MKLKYKDAKVGMRVRLNAGCSVLPTSNATIIKTKHRRPKTIQVLRDDGIEGAGYLYNGKILWLCEADEAGYLHESGTRGPIIDLIGGLIECSHCGLEAYTDIKCTYCGYYNKGDE